MALGNAGNRGPGTVFSLGTAALDRVQRSKRAVRRRRLTAQRDRAAGRPGVVVTTNDLDLGGAERQRVLLANALVDRGHPVTVVCLQGLGLYTAELDPRVRLEMQPWWQPVVEVAGDEAIVVGGVTNTEVGFARTWRALGRTTGGLARRRAAPLVDARDPRPGRARPRHLLRAARREPAQRRRAARPVRAAPHRPDPPPAAHRPRHGRPERHPRRGPAARSARPPTRRCRSGSRC